MNMNVATLTVNPTVDVSMEVDEVFHTHKMRGRNQRSDPGGGGICVARVLVRLGNNARCFYMSAARRAWHSTACSTFINWCAPASR